MRDIICSITAVGCLTLVGCLADNRYASGDPLLGGTGQGLLTQNAGPPPGTAAPLPLQPGSTSSPSTAALASNPPQQPLDGGRDLRIGDTHAQDNQPWRGQGTPTATAINRPEPPPANPSAQMAAQSTASGGGSHPMSYEQAQAALTAHGVTWQRLESTDQGSWKFSCSVPNPQNRLLSRTYEGTAHDYLSAIQSVIDQVSKDH
jgi:hypothetical protein